MLYEEWIEIGVKAGWCTAPVCYTHDGLPMTDAEAEEMYEDMDLCIHIVRLCGSVEEQQTIEKDHAPAAWRRSNQGL